MEDYYLAFCGIRCDLCSVYTKNYHSMDKKRFCEGMNAYFGYNITPQDIKECRGCLIDGEKNCSIKPCAIEREVENCSLCEDFPCPKNKEMFDAIYKNVKDVSEIPATDYEMFFRPYESEKNFNLFKENNP